MSDLALIFDLDGTLIDSAPDIHIAVNQVMTRADLPHLTQAQVRGFVGNGASVLLERCLKANGHPGTGPDHARLYEMFLAVYEDAHDLTTVYPGVRGSLNALSGYRLGLCTNKPAAPTRSVLAHLGLLQSFEVIVAGDTLPQRKPDPAPLLETLRQMGGGRAVFVGDSEVDAETAARADVPFVLFTKGYRKIGVEAFVKRAFFEDWTDFPGIISALK